MNYEQCCDCHSSAKGSYENLCYELRSSENKLSALQADRRRQVNLINQLEAEIKNNKAALKQIKEATQHEEAFNDSVGNIKAKTNKAANNFSGMAKVSDTKVKNLNDVFSEEMTKTEQGLNNIFRSIIDKKMSLEAKIQDLEKRLRAAQAELESIDSNISATKADIQDLKNAKTTAYCNVQYYEQKMRMAE